MSNAMLEKPVEQPIVESPRTNHDIPRDDFATGEFNYRPVPVMAVAGLVLALLSSVGVAVWLVLPLCAVAALMSALGLWTIRRSRGEYGGQGVAWAGLALSLTFLLGGLAFQVHQYQTEIPPGFERISFLNDISEKKIIQQDNQVFVHPDVAQLDGKEVFVKGYIYQAGPTKYNKFMFVKDNRDCCFGADVKIWDQLWVTMPGKETIDFVSGKVAVAGTFRINREWNPTEKESPLYLIDAKRFLTHVSDF